MLYTFEDLRNPRDRATNKLKLYQDLTDPSIVGIGIQDPYSWEDGSVPSSLVEVEAQGLTEFQVGAQATLYSGFNELAEGAALAEHSKQVYQNTPLEGQQTIGLLTLTDSASGGPFTFSATGISASVGEGGLVFDGIADPNDGTTQYTLPLNGSVRIFIEAREVGSQYDVAIGTIDTFIRGILGGVTVSNEAGWLSGLGTQQGADPEQTAPLRTRNRTKWATLGVGSPPSAYEHWARTSDASITRVEVFRNLSLLDPGTVTVLIAGAGGALGPTAVQNAQTAIAPRQVGGKRIPATARAVVASAANNVIPISGKIYLESTINASTAKAQIAANILIFQASLRIGALVSWDRLVEVCTYIAGLDPDLIPDVEDFSPTADEVQAYYQVAVFDLTNLQVLPR